MKHLGGLVVAGFAGLLVVAATGCAGTVESVPTSKTTITAATMTKDSSAVAPKELATEAAPAEASVARDGELTGSEHHVSLLEGRLTFKIHATEAPKVTTGSTAKGMLYSTLEAKLGDGQTVHCAAYNDVIWPAGVVASDLRGEHDWADDGAEKPDAVAKTKAEIAKFDVTAINGTPVIAARAVVRDQQNKVVAHRKIAVMSSTATTFLCSDRTIGFSSRFGKFAGEAFASAHLDPAPVPPSKLSLYKIFDVDGTTPVGYRQVATYVDGKGVVKTFSDEARLTWVNSDAGSIVTGDDSLTSSVSNAKGDETEIRYDAAVDGTATTSASVTHDAKGWHVNGTTLKTAPLDMFGPAWTAKLRAVAKTTGKKAATPAKVTLFTPKGAVSATMQRSGENAVSINAPNGETPVTVDENGIVSMTLSGHAYKRVSAK